MDVLADTNYVYIYVIVASKCWVVQQITPYTMKQFAYKWDLPCCQCIHTCSYVSIIHIHYVKGQYMHTNTSIDIYILCCVFLLWYWRAQSWWKYYSRIINALNWTIASTQVRIPCVWAILKCRGISDSVFIPTILFVHLDISIVCLIFDGTVGNVISFSFINSITVNMGRWQWLD